MEDSTKWAVDKRIPVVSLIAGAVFMLTQTVVFIIFLSNLHFRVSAVEEYVKATAPQTSQLAVTQEKVTAMQRTLDKIEGWLQATHAPRQ